MNPTDFFSKLQVKTVIDCLNSPNKSFAGVRAELDKETGNAFIRNFLNIVLVDLVNFFNVGKSMNHEQIIVTSGMIVDDYCMLKPDDLKLCFDNAKKGKYGKVYDRIDGQIIFEWLELYLEERVQAIETLRRNESQQHKKDSAIPIIPMLPLSEKDKPVPMPSWFNIPEKKVPEINTRPLNQTDQQKQINGWIREFDALWMSQGSLGGKRFVTIDSKKIDVSEYLEIKICTL